MPGHVDGDLSGFEHGNVPLDPQNRGLIARNSGEGAMLQEVGFFAIWPNLKISNRMKSFEELWWAMDIIMNKEKDEVWLRSYLEEQRKSFVQEGAFQSTISAGSEFDGKDQI